MVKYKERYPDQDPWQVLKTISKDCDAMDCYNALQSHMHSKTNIAKAQR